MSGHPVFEICVDSVTLRMPVKDADRSLTHWHTEFRGNHHTGSMSSEAEDTCIENRDFDSFARALDALHVGSGERADLHDVPGKFLEQNIGAYLVLRLEPAKNASACSLLVREPYTGERGADLPIKTHVLKDRIPRIVRAFESSPKWW